jgi:hypothetical protein
VSDADEAGSADEQDKATADKANAKAAPAPPPPDAAFLTIKTLPPGGRGLINGQVARPQGGKYAFPIGASVTVEMAGYESYVVEEASTMTRGQWFVMTIPLQPLATPADSTK